MLSDGATFASVYSGAGGLDIGFIEAGFAPVFSIDVDPSAVATYEASLERLCDRIPHLVVHEHQCHCGDIDDHMPDLAAVSADIVIGGPPCQGFSVAGKMDPSDPRSRHVWRFLDAVEAVGPTCFVMENVKALAENRRWARLLDALRDQADGLGYATEVLVLNAGAGAKSQSPRSAAWPPRGPERDLLVSRTRTGRSLNATSHAASG